jgi:hypothetical protein
MLASGVIGHLFSSLNALQRCLLLAAAGMLVFASKVLLAAGLAVGLGVAAWSFVARRAAPAAASTLPGSGS